MPRPVSNPHTSFLKCLREAHVKEKYRICKGFRPCTLKDRDIHLKALLLEASLCPGSEPCCSDSSASVRSAPLASGSSQHCSSSPYRKRGTKNSAATGGTPQHHRETCGEFLMKHDLCRAAHLPQSCSWQQLRLLGNSVRFSTHHRLLGTVGDPYTFKLP